MMMNCRRLLWVALLVGAVSSAATAKDRLVYETPREFFASGDFNGDGRDDLALVDKATGKYRLAYGQADGALVWVDCRSSGIAATTGFAVGRLLKEDRDALAFTSPDAQQIFFVDASSTLAPSRPKNVPFSALGPNLLVAEDIGGGGNTPLDDLYVTSVYNSPDANIATLIRNDGGDFPKTAETVLPGAAAHGQAVSLKAGGPRFAGMLVSGDKGDELRVEDHSSGKPVNIATATGFPRGVEYTVGNFRPGKPNDFIFFNRGASNLIVCAVEEASAGKFRFGTARTFDLRQAIRQVTALDGGKLLVIFGEGEKLGVLDFDGVNAPKLITTIASGENEQFSGVMPRGSPAFVAFTQPPAGQFSTKCRALRVVGKAFVDGGSGDLPSLADNDNITIPDIYSRIASSSVVPEGRLQPYTNTIPGTRVSFVMVPIPAGEFVMGSPDSEPGRKPDEGPQHKAQISPFWMGQCEVTWNQYELFMYPDQDKATRGAVPTDEAGDQLADAVTHPSRPYLEMSFGMGKDGYPAIAMTQHGANKFCQWLSAKTGQFYRLPTEAEWEYACRAGTTTTYYFGDDTAQLKDYAWYEENSEFKYQRVGKKKPNPWGLFDMYGNVTEWVLDQYDPGFYKASAAKGTAVDPWNRVTKGYPIAVRGGSWDDPAVRCRSAARRGSDRAWKMQDPQLPKSIWFLSDGSFVGFRVVRPLKVPSAEEMQRYWNNGVHRE